MASLSDPIAEVAGIFLTLKGKSLTPDIAGQIRCLKENFAVIQEKIQELNDDLKLKNIEIEKLEAEKTGWEEKFKAESARHYEISLREMSTALELKHIKIKELEKKVSKLEAEKEILKEQVETLETEVKELKGKIGSLENGLKKVKGRNTALEHSVTNLRAELVVVREENRESMTKVLLSTTEKETLRQDVNEFKKTAQTLEKNNTSLKQSVHDLKKNNTTIKQSVDDLKKDNHDLRKDNTSLKQSVHDLKTNNKFLEGKVEDLERNFRGSEEQLILGELCRCVQSMIFEKLLPSKLYDVKENYTIKKMDQHFERAFNYNEYEIKAAIQDWAELQKELKLQERDVRTMKYVMKKLQTTRNVVAHPELTEDSLTKATERMNSAGLLGDDRMPGDIMRIINVWKQLKMMP